MKQTALAARDLARQILTQEDDTSQHPETQAYAALHVFEQLRVRLSKVVGVAGFQTLLLRARVLAAAEVRWLESVQVHADGGLKEFTESMQQQDREAALEGCVAFLGQLLGLLVTFIGEDLTLRLVQDVWPDAALNDIDAGAEEAPK